MLQRKVVSCFPVSLRSVSSTLVGRIHLMIFPQVRFARLGSISVVSFCTLFPKLPLKEVIINMYLLLRVVLRNWNKLFSQGWAKWTAAQAASHFLVFFFLCLGALICGIRLHNLSANSPKCFRTGAPVLAKPDA